MKLVVVLLLLTVRRDLHFLVLIGVCSGCVGPRRERIVVIEGGGAQRLTFLLSAARRFQWPCAAAHFERPLFLKPAKYMAARRYVNG